MKELTSDNQRVKIIRKRLKINQETFGEAIGLTQSAITLIENGRSKVTEQTKLLLIHIYDVNRKWLESGEEPMFLDLNIINGVNEPGSVYNPEVASDAEFWKNKYLTINDKYMELNEKYISVLERNSNTHREDKSQAS